MKKHDSHFDTIVVGGGLGGLCTALLLADSREPVLLLEAHTMTGGCAGAFDRFERVGEGPGRGFRRFRFDVGATTLSGLGPGRPFDLLFNRIGDPPPLRRIDPGLIHHTREGTPVHRHADRDRWIDEASRRFGSAGAQGAFWRELGALSDRCWRLAMGNLRFPPSTPGDLLSLIRPSNLQALPLLPDLRRSVADLLRRHGLDRNERFCRFIEEGLMITTQSGAADAPLTVGSMGLDYPADTWYPDGGMYGVANWMERKIRERGGVVRTKHRVTGVARSGETWQVDSVRGRFTCRHLVANLTLWDLERLIENPPVKLQREAGALPGGWGALYWTAAIPDVIDDLGSLYHQVVVDPLPFAGSHSLFISLSPGNDRLRTPEGFRTVAVSTHVPRPEEWIRMRTDEPGEYARRKGAFAAQVHETLHRIFPDLEGESFLYEEVATPSSFHFFTGRHQGSVGGVPFTLDRSLFSLPDHRSGHPALSIVGDTVYPGQGAPALVLAAMKVVESRR